MRVVESVAALIDEQHRGQDRLLVCIDGPDAAGKTTLADELAGRVRGHVVRASIDGFHNPREVRSRRGELSPEGYYRDSFDLDALKTRLLEPFADGTDEVRTRVFDFRDDGPVDGSPVEVPARSVLLFDGVFLLRPELRDRWDLSLYLHVSSETTMERALARDLSLFGSEEEVRRRYEARYLPGQELYRTEADPLSAADIVIDNTDYEEPVLLTSPPASTRRG